MHVAARVVEVAAAAPVLAFVFIAKGVSVGIGPCFRLSTIVVAGDVGRGHLIGDAFIGLGGVVHPGAVHAEVVAVVDDHVGNDARAFRLEGGDHRA